MKPQRITAAEALALYRMHKNKQHAGNQNDIRPTYNKPYMAGVCVAPPHKAPPAGLVRRYFSLARRIAAMVLK